MGCNFSNSTEVIRNDDITDNLIQNDIWREIPSGVLLGFIEFNNLPMHQESTIGFNNKIYYKKAINNVRNTECPICYKKINKNEKYCTCETCLYNFDYNELDKWFKITNKEMCPTCKSKWTDYKVYKNVDSKKI